MRCGSIRFWSLRSFENKWTDVFHIPGFFLNCVSLSLHFLSSNKFLDHGIPRLNECVNLFRHDYTKANILQLINSASEITDDTLVEIVLSGMLGDRSVRSQFHSTPNLFTIHDAYSIWQPTFRKMASKSGLISWTSIRINHRRFVIFAARCSSV